MELTATKPKARREGLSVTVAGTETLVYDPDQFMIHRLGTETATIWQLADGARDIETLTADVRRELGESVSRHAVEDALRELADMGLIDDVPAEKRKVSRRMLVGGALGVAAASSYIPASAASPVENVCPEYGIAGCAKNPVAIYYIPDSCIPIENPEPGGPLASYDCSTRPQGQGRVFRSTGFGFVEMSPNESSRTSEDSNLDEDPDQQLFEIETIDTPFEESPTQEPTEAPTESPTVEGVVDALSEPVPSETAPPAEPVTVETVPPAEPAVTTQGDAQPVPVVEEPAPVVPTEVPPPPPVQESAPVPVAPNVDTSIEVEVVIDD